MRAGQFQRLHLRTGKWSTAGYDQAPFQLPKAVYERRQVESRACDGGHGIGHLRAPPPYVPP